jgi:hypothetical protein
LYGVDHHSRAIKDLYSVFISKKLPNFISYLDTRLVSTPQTIEFTKANIKDGLDVGIIASDLFFDFKEVRSQLTESCSDKLETNIVSKFVDMPGVYHYMDKDFGPLFDELSSTENYEYFTPAAIKHLIDFNYPLVKKYIIRKLFVPFVCFIAFYCFFIHYIYPERLNEDYKI